MSWEEYYAKNKGRPPRALYSQAVQFLNPSSLWAVDLGCGDGTEVFDLIQRGLEVHAVDKEPNSIERIKNHPAVSSQKLHTHFSSLESWEVWPTVDFVFAYHSFPFCGGEKFFFVVEKSLSSVVTGGVWAASFFGPEDDWVKDQKVIGISAHEVRALLGDFVILSFKETKKVGPTSLQGDKMWNVIEVIARRN